MNNEFCQTSNTYRPYCQSNRCFNQGCSSNPCYPSPTPRPQPGCCPTTITIGTTTTGAI